MIILSYKIVISSNVNPLKDLQTLRYYTIFVSNLCSICMCVIISGYVDYVILPLGLIVKREVFFFLLQ